MSTLNTETRLDYRRTKVAVPFWMAVIMRRSSSDVPNRWRHLLRACRFCIFRLLLAIWSSPYFIISLAAVQVNFALTVGTMNDPAKIRPRCRSRSASGSLWRPLSPALTMPRRPMFDADGVVDGNPTLRQRDRRHPIAARKLAQPNAVLRFHLLAPLGGSATDSPTNVMYLATQYSGGESYC